MMWTSGSNGLSIFWVAHKELASTFDQVLSKYNLKEILAIGIAKQILQLMWFAGNQKIRSYDLVTARPKKKSASILFN
jgi:hypothetical protein